MSDKKKRKDVGAAVERAMRLAKLAYSSREAERFIAKAAAVLGYVEQLSELDTSGITPTSHAVDFESALRPDRARPCDEAEELVAQAPERDGAFVQVPRVIESE